LILTARLDSRAQVILESVRHTDVVSVGLWNIRGSRDETAAQAGFSHFLEHMLFKGTERRNAFQIAREVERVGGFLNAFTEKEVLCCYCTLPAEDLELAVDVLADMYFHSVLDPRELEKEKAVVINEIQAAEDNPEEKAHQLYLEGLWNGHELSRKITGESAEVSAISRERLASFYRERFSGEHTVVTASGRLEPEALLEQLNRRFPNQAAWQGPPAVPQRRPPERRRSRVLKRDKFEQVQVYTGLSYPSARRAADYYQDLVFNTLFGESMSSRLFQDLRGGNQDMRVGKGPELPEDRRPSPGGYPTIHNGYRPFLPQLGCHGVKGAGERHQDDNLLVVLSDDFLKDTHAWAEVELD